MNPILGCSRNETETYLKLACWLFPVMYGALITGAQIAGWNGRHVSRIISQVLVVGVRGVFFGLEKRYATGATVDAILREDAREHFEGCQERG